MSYLFCHLYHIFDSYEYIIVFSMVEKAVFDLKIKHFLSVHGCRDEQFLWCLEFFIIN